MAREFTNDVRRRVQTLTGIAPEAVLLNASHNHSGPPGVPRRSGVSLGQAPAAYDGYAAALPDLVAGAVFSAWYNRRPARIGAGMGQAAGISVNRVHRDDPKDEQVGVLRVDAEDGEPIATVARFSCHGTCMAGQTLLWNADFAAPLRDTVARERAGETLFLQGCAGDIAPWDFWFGNDEAKRHTYENRDELGARLGAEVLRVLPGIQTTGDTRLGYTSRMLPMERRKLAWDDDELDLVARSLENAPPPDFPEFWPDDLHTTNSAQRFQLHYQRGRGADVSRHARPPGRVAAGRGPGARHRRGGGASSPTRSSCSTARAWRSSQRARSAAPRRWCWGTPTTTSGTCLGRRTFA